MGKKQKIALKQKGVDKTKIEIIQDEIIIQNDSQIKNNDKISKLSKKQRRKLRKQQIDTNNNTQKHPAANTTVNKSQTISTDKIHPIKILIQQQQQCQQQNAIEIIQQSSSLDQEINNNDIELNPRGEQGFQSLVNQTNQNTQNVVKSITIQSTLLSPIESETKLYLFHLKKNNFYKITAPLHENINLTHLNETVKISIIDQNLLKHGSNDHNCQFWQNGKIIGSQIEFIKSTVFKIINHNQDQSKQTKTNIKDKKKYSQNTQQIIKKNILLFIQPTNETYVNQIFDFLHDFEWKEDSLVICKENLIFCQTHAPFQNIDQKILSSNGSLMILGKKNTGKSTLAEYLLNTNPTKVCILDCDIGRSITLSGSVSLITQTQTINLWVGEFTPFNCISNYVNAIENLYQLYRQKYFSKKLIINTMGYLSGLGQMIIYQIYSLVNPAEIIVLTTGNQQQQQQGNDSLGSILYHIKTGSYLNKLLTATSSQHTQKRIRRFNEKKLNLNIQYLTNIHAQGKGIPIRFESLLLYKKSFKNILQLIQSIQKHEMQKIQNLNFYQQDKLGNISQLNRYEKNHSNMRIILIGKWLQLNINKQTIQPQKLFRVFGIGYGFNNSVYYSQHQIQKVISPSINMKQQSNNIVGILSQGIDFEKNFYLINQLTLIEHELIYNSIPYIIPIIKGMGSKGIRNNPSKNI